MHVPLFNECLYRSMLIRTLIGTTKHLSPQWDNESFNIFFLPQSCTSVSHQIYPKKIKRGPSNRGFCRFLFMSEVVYQGHQDSEEMYGCKWLLGVKTTVFVLRAPTCAAVYLIIHSNFETTFRSPTSGGFISCSWIIFSLKRCTTP